MNDRKDVNGWQVVAERERKIVSRQNCPDLEEAKEVLKEYYREGIKVPRGVDWPYEGLVAFADVCKQKEKDGLKIDAWDGNERIEFEEEDRYCNGREYCVYARPVTLRSRLTWDVVEYRHVDLRN